MAPVDQRVGYLEGKIESLATKEGLETHIVYALIGDGE